MKSENHRRTDLAGNKYVHLVVYGFFEQIVQSGTFGIFHDLFIQVFDYPELSDIPDQADGTPRAPYAKEDRVERISSHLEEKEISQSGHKTAGTDTFGKEQLDRQAEAEHDDQDKQT